jgi:hypothetical protein
MTQNGLYFAVGKLLYKLWNRDFINLFLDVKALKGKNMF